MMGPNGFPVQIYFTARKKRGNHSVIFFFGVNFSVLDRHYALYLCLSLRVSSIRQGVRHQEFHTKVLVVVVAVVCTFNDLRRGLGVLTSDPYPES